MAILLQRAEPWREESPGVRVRRVLRAPEADLKIYRVDPGSLLPSHVHGESHVGMVVEGGGVSRFSGEVHRLTAGDGHRVPPGVYHEFETNPVGSTLIVELEVRASLPGRRGGAAPLAAPAVVGQLTSARHPDGPVSDLQGPGAHGRVPRSLADLRNAPDGWVEVQPGARQKVLVRSPEAVFMLYDLAPNLEFRRHVHPLAQMGLVLDGGGRHEIGGTVRTTRAGQGYYIPPGVVHSFSSDHGRTLLVDVVVARELRDAPGSRDASPLLDDGLPGATFRALARHREQPP